MKDDRTTIEGSPRSAAVVAGVLLLAGTLSACSGGSEARPGSEGARQAPVDVTVAERDSLVVVIPSVGSLEANARVNLTAEVAGAVTGIFVTEGDTVRQGEILIRLNDRKLEAEVQRAEAALARMRTEEENLRKQVERNDRLLSQGAISEQAYDDLRTSWEAAQARLQEARAELNVAREELADARVRAPFSGRVGERQVDMGDYVTPGDPMILLVNDDPLEIDFSVPERYVGRLALGKTVAVTVQSQPDREFSGRVYFVSPVVDPINRTVKLKARVPNPIGELRAGQFASVTLELETRPDALLVPEQAVVPRREGSVIYVVEGGLARARQVSLGARRRGQVQITAGIQPGDSVVVSGHQRLEDGTPVRIVGGSASGDGGPPSDGAPSGSAPNDGASDGPVPEDEG